ncbi:hypothetical protein BC833DRAFT_619212 [Globomyces pollinis-pini]|nr:hypothetical protein BC833DRAFT_619212 [Globomyces pollinis-pini]
MESKPTRRIIIIGAGPTGLCLALALKRININLKVVIYESNSYYTDLKSQHWNLWKPAIKALLELGLGKRLGKISVPLTNLKSTDTTTGESLCNWSIDNHNVNISDTSKETDNLPPMIGVRKIDLIRMLMTALVGREDLVSGQKLDFSNANNSDFIETPVEGIEADLAKDDWFTNEGFDGLLPDIQFGYTLESYLISATIGTVSLKFTNGHTDEGTMLIGCDGVHSLVRSFLLNDRFPVQYCKQLCIHGITKIQVPDTNETYKITDDQELKRINETDIHNFCSSNSVNTWVGSDYSFGVSHLGNNMLGWSFNVSQPQPDELAQKWIMPIRRQAVINFMQQKNTPLPISRMSSDGSAGEWQVPEDNGLTPSAEIPATPRIKPDTSIAYPKLPAIAFEAEATSEKLSGVEAKELAIRLGMEAARLPKYALNIMAFSEPHFTGCLNNVDLYGEDEMKSYTSAKFHPGRVMLLGDAAHGLATSSRGSHGGSLGICDAIVLAKIIGHDFSPSEINKTKKELKITLTDPEQLNGIILDQISRRYCDLRLRVCNQAQLDARMEAVWVKKEPGFWKNLLTISVGHTWVRTSFDEMMEKGKVDMGDEREYWPSLTSYK